jgi:hypothetical protein
MAARANNVFWLVETLKIFLSETMKPIELWLYGGHLEFPISKRFTNLVQDHPMIIPAKSQFNWFGGFWQEDFQGFNQSEHVIGPGSQKPKTQIW